MWSSSDLMSSWGTELRHSEANVWLLLAQSTDSDDVWLADAAGVTMATNKIITVDNGTIPIFRV